MKIRKFHLIACACLVLLLIAESHGFVSTAVMALLRGINSFIYRRIEYYLPHNVIQRMTNPSYAAAIKCEYHNRLFYEQHLMEKKTLYKHLITEKKPLLMGLGGALGALFGFVSPWMLHPVFSLVLLVLSVGLPTLRALLQSKHGPVVFCSTLLYMPVNEMVFQVEPVTVKELLGEEEQAVRSLDLNSQSLMEQREEVQEKSDGPERVVGEEVTTTATAFEPDTVLFSASHGFQILEHVWVSVLVLLFAWLSSSWMFGFTVMIEYYYVRYYIIQNYCENTASFVQDLKFMTVWLWVVQFLLAKVIQLCSGEDKDLFTYFTFDFIWQYFDLSEESPRCKTRFIGTMDAEVEQARAERLQESWLDIGVKTLFMGAVGALSAKVYVEYMETNRHEWSQQSPPAISSTVTGSEGGVSDIALQTVPMPLFKKTIGSRRHYRHRPLNAQSMSQLPSLEAMEAVEADCLRQRRMALEEEERVRRILEEQRRQEELERERVRKEEERVRKEKERLKREEERLKREKEEEERLVRQREQRIREEEEREREEEATRRREEEERQQEENERLRREAEEAERPRRSIWNWWS